MFMFLLSVSSMADRTDSLLQRLDTADITEQVNIYNDLSKMFFFSDPSKTVVYGEKALEIADSIDMNPGRFSALRNIGVGYSCLGDNMKAVEYHRKALDLAIEMDDRHRIAIAHNELGVDYRFLDNYEKSLEHFLDALEVGEAQTDNGATVSDKSDISGTMSNIGVIYNDLGNLDKALEYYGKALEIREEIGDRKGIAASLNNMGVIYQNRGEFQKALDLHTRSLRIKRELDNERDIAKSLNNIGIIYFSQDEFKRSLGYHLQALEIYRQVGDRLSEALTSNRIARCYIKLDQLESAYRYINNAIDLSRQTGAKKQLADSYDLLAEYYNNTGQYAKAAATLANLVELRDSLYNEALAEKIAEMESKYEVEKKEREIELLTKDREIQALKIRRQSLRLYLLIGFIVFTGVLIWLLFNRYKLKQKNFRSELERRNLETEHRLMRSQMNPHFIFNSLNSVQSYISGNEPMSAMSYLSKFATLMRFILENSMRSMIPIGEEIETLKLYVELERARLNGKFDFSITADPQIDHEEVMVPPMLVQPFVENAIKHGLKNRQGTGQLDIHFGVNEKALICTVRDDGIGRKMAEEIRRSERSGHRSVGVELTRERLTAMEKDFGTRLELKIRDLEDPQGKPAGTEIVIPVPFHSDEEL